MPYCSTPIRPLRTWLSECSKGAFWGLKVSNSAWLHFTRPLAQPPFSLLTLVRPAFQEVAVVPGQNHGCIAPAAPTVPDGIFLV